MHFFLAALSNIPFLIRWRAKQLLIERTIVHRLLVCRAKILISTQIQRLLFGYNKVLNPGLLFFFFLLAVRATETKEEAKHI
jgi:hypothetical protein